MNEQISPHAFPTDGATTAGEPTTDFASFLAQWSVLQHQVESLRRQLAERAQEVERLKSLLAQTP